MLPAVADDAPCFWPGKAQPPAAGAFCPGRVQPELAAGVVDEEDVEGVEDSFDRRADSLIGFSLDFERRDSASCFEDDLGIPPLFESLDFCSCSDFKDCNFSRTDITS